MKNMKKFFGMVLLSAALLPAALLTACDSDNDDNTAPTEALTISDLTGTYAGTFDFTPVPSDLNPDPAPENGVAVELQVEDGQVIFPDFPAPTLIKALVGEEGAAGLVPMLGTITYTATLDTPTADSEMLTSKLIAPVLRLDVGGVLVVLITIEAPGELRYVKDGTLTFTLKTTKCQLGEGESAGEPFDLVNELNFTVSKH